MCGPRRRPARVFSAVPLLVGRRSMQIYPGAYHDFDWPDLPLRQLPQYRTRAGVIPITGTEPAARQDALTRVPAFLARYLDR
jgi:dienelactone hydrolase